MKRDICGREELLDRARGLPDAMLVLDERDAHKPLPVLAKADTRRNRVLASTPLLVVATIMVLGEVGSLAKGAVFRYPVYTTAKANLAALSSGLSPTSCAMA